MQFGFVICTSTAPRRNGRPGASDYVPAAFENLVAEAGTKTRIAIAAGVRTD